MGDSGVFQSTERFHQREALTNSNERESRIYPPLSTANLKSSLSPRTWNKENNNPDNQLQSGYRHGNHYTGQTINNDNHLGHPFHPCVERTCFHRPFSSSNPNPQLDQRAYGQNNAESDSRDQGPHVMFRPPRHPYNTTQPFLSNQTIERATTVRYPPLSTHSATGLPSLMDSPLFRKAPNRPTTSNGRVSFGFHSNNVDLIQTSVEVCSNQQVFKPPSAPPSQTEPEHIPPVSTSVANNRHSENEILPALKHQISNSNNLNDVLLHEPLDFATLLEETLKNADQPIESNTTEGDAPNVSIEELNVLHETRKPKRQFLKKGARNAFTIIPPKSSVPKYTSWKPITEVESTNKGDRVLRKDKDAGRGAGKGRGQIQARKSPVTAKGHRFSVPTLRPKGASSQQRMSVIPQLSKVIDPLLENGKNRLTGKVVQKNMSQPRQQHWVSLKQHEEQIGRRGGETEQTRGVVTRPQLATGIRPSLHEVKQQHLPLPVANSRKHLGTLNTNIHGTSVSPLDSIVMAKRHESRLGVKSEIESVKKQNNGNPKNMITMMTTMTDDGDHEDHMTNEIASSRISISGISTVTDQGNTGRRMETSKNETRSKPQSPLKKTTGGKIHQRSKSPVELLDEIDILSESPNLLSERTGCKIQQRIGNNPSSAFIVPDSTSTLFGYPGSSYGEMKRKDLGRQRPSFLIEEDRVEGVLKTSQQSERVSIK